MIAKLKTEKGEILQQAEALRKQLADMEKQLTEARTSSKQFKAVNSELSKQLQDTVHQIVVSRSDAAATAAKDPVPTMTTEWDGLMQNSVTAGNSTYATTSFNRKPASKK